MASRTSIHNDVTLATVLPAAPFAERHARIVDASPQRVWDALTTLSWSHLRLSLPLLAVRAGGRARGARAPLLAHGPVDEIAAAAPWFWIGARIGKPWQPRPEFVAGPLALDEFVAFAEPGWLKYGMEFRLDALGDGRTAVTTTTRCVPTDEAARRRFARYWWVIRPFSGLVRHDMLWALARRAERPGAAQPRSGGARQGDHRDDA